MKPAKIPNWKEIPNLMDLIYLADINFLICKKIYSGPLASTIKNWPAGVQKHPGHEFLLLSANNSFFEAVNIIHTLVCSIKEEEVRIKPLLERIIDRDKNFVSKISNDKVAQLIKHVKQDYPNPDYWSYSFLTEDDDRQIGDIMAEIRKKIRIESGLDDLKEIKTKFENYDFHKIRHQTVAHKNKLLDAPAGTAHLLIKNDLIINLGEVVKDLRIAASFWFDYELINPNLYTLASLEAHLINTTTV